MCSFLLCASRIEVGALNGVANNEKQMLFDAVTHFPAIMEKAQWAMKWINDKNFFPERLVAFAAVESDEHVVHGAVAI